MKDSDVQAPFPFVSKELMDRLNELFPKKDFTTQASLRDIDFHNGIIYKILKKPNIL